jgi:hypothetical protein
MRNAVMAVMLVAAGVSSSYVNRTGGSDSPEQAVAKGKTPSLEGNLPQPIDDPLDLLKDFLDPNHHPPSTPAATCEDPIQRLRNLLNSTAQPCAPQAVPAVTSTEGSNCAVSREFWDGNLNLNFLIATIPDPERTHLGLDFDRALEAIITAAEDEGFGYDRYWLPWHVTHDPGNPDPLKQDILDGRAEERHRKPGVIILRRTPKVSYYKDAKDAQQAKEVADQGLRDSRNAALVILLVGETPTAGINRHQFKKATDYIRSFMGCSYALGVLGPTFSGSSTSLRAAIRHDFPSQTQGSLIISGTASTFEALAGLGNTTIHSDDFLSDALGTFLQTQLRVNGGVVYLKEAATDFGMSPFAPYVPTIYYPREISRLRNVWY